MHLSSSALGIDIAKRKQCIAGWFAGDQHNSRAVNHKINTHTLAESA